MGGLTEPELDEAAQLTIRNTSATIMNIAITSVSFEGATFTVEVDDRRMLEVETTDGVTRRLQDTYAANAITKVSVPLGTTDAANATELYNQLTSDLTKAVEDGTFTTRMNSVANSLGATVLATAQADGVVNSVLILFDPSDEDGGSKKKIDDDDGLTGGAIAGLVIGCVVIVLLIVGGVWYIFNYDNSGAAKATYTDGDGNTNNEINVYNTVDVAL